ncbi:HAD family hydrolase [Propionicicella superfundia]|uniref:HAD family hydrolase n=1 Tax=Propionicicella superfundia TaxID=348582 RepID=UPI000410C985|nr:HAD hydrolase-like protein [Propionicicella superfundia]
MGTPRWPTVVFDLDGTLLDSVDLIIDSYQHTFREILGHPWDDVTEVRSWIGTGLRIVFGRILPGRADEMVDVYTRWNIANTARYVRAYPGILGMLADLSAAGVRTGVATSKRRPAAELGMACAGLAERVPLLVTGDDVTSFKPEPEPLWKAVAALGGDTAAAAYVGDAVVDVRAARNAGMAAVAVAWGAGEDADLAAEHPGHVVATATDLTALVLGPRGSAAEA